MTNLNADTGPMSLLTEADFNAMVAEEERRRVSDGEIVARVALVLVLCIAAGTLALHWGVRA